MGKQSSTKPFVGYVRISNLGSREAGNNLSAEHQLASIKQTADRHDLDLNPDWIFSDEDVSGSTFERAGWSQVIELVESGTAGGVIVWNQSRASRAKSWETMAMIAAVEQAGGEIYSQAGKITVSTFEGEVLAFMNGAMDRKELVDKANGLKRSVAEAVDRGAHLQAPYGYVKADRVASRAMPLEINEAEAKAVRLMFKLRPTGMSWSAIASRLDQLGYEPRPYVRNGELVQGGWRHQAVRGIVQSRTYLGEAWNGPLRKQGAHPAIVKPDVWAKANAVKGVKPVAPDGGYTLTGLPRCASCGHVMSHAVTKGRGYYKCMNQASRKCPDPVNVPADKLTEWVEEQFKATYLIGATFDPEQSDATVKAAEASVDTAAARYAVAMDMKMDAAAGGSVRELEIATGKVNEAKSVLHDAEQTLAEANAASLGVSLPSWLDADAYDAEPVGERNEWLSKVYAFVAVRRDPVWRGPSGAGSLWSRSAT